MHGKISIGLLYRMGKNMIINLLKECCENCIHTVSYTHLLHCRKGKVTIYLLMMHKGGRKPINGLKARIAG